jgi:hypothetical protein
VAKFINYQNDPSGVLGQLTQYANSAAPAAAVLANGTPSYTTLGGKFNFASIAGAETDFPLFGFQVPVAPTLAPGTRLYIEGISISSVVSTVLGASALIIEWGLGINSTAASLATADGGGTSGVFGPRRLALGSQSFLSAAAVGTQAVDLVRTFVSSLVVENGRFLHVICRLPVGPASGVVRGEVMIDGYFGS